MHPHRPPHIYSDDTWYIITASTVNRAPYLATDSHLRLWVDALRLGMTESGIALRAWVVLRNHYHVLLNAPTGRDIALFMGRLHGRTARQFNQHDQVSGRQVWFNYWDTCIRAEADFWTRFNYIHHNAVKHGYVSNSADWAFSSYHYYLRTKSAEWLADCWERHPVIDYLEGDDF